MRCVYCLANGHLRDEQVLLEGEHLYLCAPRGQLVEGYLVIAPYRCIGCLSRLPAGHFGDLARLAAFVTGFYLDAYGVTNPTFYEQGRAGGGASSEATAGFPLHAHLCCLPLAVDLHGLLGREYARRRVAGPHEIAAAAADEPYVYVEHDGERFVYLAGSEDQRDQLARKRLKPDIAALAGLLPAQGDWRKYPGDRELEQLIERWRRTWATRRTPRT